MNDPRERLESLEQARYGLFAGLIACALVIFFSGHPPFVMFAAVAVPVLLVALSVVTRRYIALNDEIAEEKERRERYSLPQPPER